jgi:cytidine deaminase
MRKADLPKYLELIEAAKGASKFAYRPYSQYPVGAALLTWDGQIFTGCNVENCGYTQTVHAEQTALTKAISEGAMQRALDAGRTQLNWVKAVAVYAPKGNDPWPCCNCRQTLNEFGLDMDIIGESGGLFVCKSLRKLIPHPFNMEEVLASVRGDR